MKFLSLDTAARIKHKREKALTQTCFKFLGYSLFLAELKQNVLFALASNQKGSSTPDTTYLL